MLRKSILGINSKVIKDIKLIIIGKKKFAHLPNVTVPFITAKMDIEDVIITIKINGVLVKAIVNIKLLKPLTRSYELTKV